MSIQRNKPNPEPLGYGASPAGNVYNKYNSKNPLFRYLVRRFLASLDTLLKTLEGARSVLDVGCGEGYILNRIWNAGHFSRVEGIDSSPEIIRKAKSDYPHLNVRVGSAYSLPYKEGEFEALLMCEVLEHLGRFEDAVYEAKRVTAKYVIISVPVEPLWRVCNLIRGKYILSLGNTPGHVQHWGKAEFRELLEGHFAVEKILYPLPWQMALCTKK